MSPHSRHRLLAATLLATLVAAWLAPEGADTEGTAVAALTPMPDLLDWPQPPEPPSLLADPDDASMAGNDLSGQGRRARTGDGTAPEPPLAPPSPPFRMFGRLDREGQVVAFVTHAGSTLTVTTGEQLPGEWLVDAIGSDGMVLTYLPLGQTVRIPFKAPAK